MILERSVGYNANSMMTELRSVGCEGLRRTQFICILSIAFIERTNNEYVCISYNNKVLMENKVSLDV
jgi:hypothetical protein